VTDPGGGLPREEIRKAIDTSVRVADEVAATA
jgi:hypothetical protein